MKRKLIAIIVMSLLFSGCANKADVKEAEVKETKLIDSEVKESSISNPEVEKYRNPSMDIFVEEEPLVKREIVYDMKGNLLAVYDHEYDELKRETKLFYRYYENEELKPCYTYNYSYDDEYKYEEMIYHLLGDAVANKIYNNKGDDIKTEFYSDGELVSYNTNIEYETSGNTVISTYWIDSEENAQIHEVEYDDMGNEIRSTFSNVDGSERSEMLFDYDFDKNGNITKEVLTEHTDNAISYTITRNYVYENNLLMESEEVSSSDSDIKIKKYEYDAEGRCVKEVTSYKNSSDNSIDKEKGNIIVYEYEVDLKKEISVKLDM